MLRKPGIVRTGSHDPWGTIGHVAGADLSEWFDREGTPMPSPCEERAMQFDQGSTETKERQQ